MSVSFIVLFVESRSSSDVVIKFLTSGSGFKPCSLNYDFRDWVFPVSRLSLGFDNNVQSLLSY